MADSQVNVGDVIGELKNLLQAELKRSDELSESSQKLSDLSVKILTALSALELRFAELEARVDRLESSSEE